MATTAGALSQVSVGSNVASLLSAAATGGAAPYTYQWYRSTTSGFSPGAGNLISGATALSLSDSGLIPNTVYYYKVVATDSGAVAGTSSQLAVTTAAPSQSQNAFSQSPYLGMVDQQFDYNTKAVLIDVSQATPLYAGSPVKIVNSAGGVPKVVGCSASSDVVFGFLNFDIKTVQFLAGAAAEISQSGNVMYLYATTAIARGSRVTLDVPNNGVAQLVGSSGASIVGYALDQAPAPGALIRVEVTAPAFAVA